MNHSGARPLVGSRYASRLLGTRSNGACSGSLDCLAPPGALHGNICFARGALSRTLGNRRTVWSPRLSVLGQEVQAIINPVVGTRHGSGRCAMKVHDCAELPLALAALISLLASAAGAQEKNETRYVVGRNPIVSITNKYGPVTAHRGGPLSRDRPRPSEPPCGT